MYLRMVELQFATGWLASEIRDRIAADLLPEISAQPGFVAYYVVETDDNRLATVRVFNDLTTLDDANQATDATQDAIIQEFTITTSEDRSFSGEVFASA
jgi:hypothetical protein